MAISAPDDIAIVEMEAPNRRHSVASLSDIDEDVVYKSFTQLRQRRKSLTQSVGKTKKKGKAEKTEDGFDIDDYRNVQNDGDLQLFTTPGMIFQHIQKQKQVIQNVRFQPWPMRVKKNTVKTAQSYVSQYEGQLSKREGYQERGQQYWRKFQRIWNNLVVIFLPWELRIKTIESHFGSSVASYFVFLRWLTAVNLLYALLWLLVILPEIFVGEKPGESARKTVPVGEEGVALDFDTIWDFNGYVKYSVLFYGYYGSNPYLGNGYQLPLAYLLVGLATYAVSFIVILRKMAANSRMSKMSSPNEQFTFCWKVFTGWDFMIGNAETADKTVAANATVLREAIIEMEEKEKENERKPVTVFLRVLANLLVIIVLCGSGYAIYQVVLRSQEFEQVEDKSTLSWWETNEVSIVVTMITLVCPSLFEMIGAMESYHPRVALRWQLARIMVLYMGNLYTLIIALLGRVSDMTKNSRASYEANMGTLAALRGDLWDVQNQTIHDPYNSTDISRNRNGSISELIRNITNVEDQLKMLGPDDCWETVVGQEFFKLVFFDLVAVVLGTLCGDFLRAVSVRYLNYCCCWDLEMKFPEYPEFKIAENVLHLVYNQGMVWMGCFFSPCLAAFNVLKLVITLYIRAWAVVTCNVPHERIFRASRSNNFYLTLLLVMLFLCVLAFGYSVVAIQPSHNCGPFSNYTSMLDVIGQSMESSFPHWLNSVIDYMNTAGVVVPLLLFLWMAIYYLWALQGSLKDANNDLRIQLEYERTESRNKLYELTSTKNKDTKKSKPKIQPKHGVPVLPAIPSDYQLRKTTRDSRDDGNVRQENGIENHVRKTTASSNSNGVRYIPLPTGQEIAVVKRTLTQDQNQHMRIKLAVDEDVIVPDGMRARYYYRGQPVTKEVWMHLKSRAMENNRKKLASISVISSASTTSHDDVAKRQNGWSQNIVDKHKKKREKMRSSKETRHRPTPPKRDDSAKTDTKSDDETHGNRRRKVNQREGGSDLRNKGTADEKVRRERIQQWIHESDARKAVSEQIDTVTDDDVPQSTAPIRNGRREPDGQESNREKLKLALLVAKEGDSDDETQSEDLNQGDNVEEEKDAVAATAGGAAADDDDYDDDGAGAGDVAEVGYEQGEEMEDEEVDLEREDASNDEQDPLERDLQEHSESEIEETDLEEEITHDNEVLNPIDVGNGIDVMIQRSNKPLRNDIELTDVLLSEEKIRRQRQGYAEPSTSQGQKKDLNPAATWEVNTLKRRAKLFEVEVTSEYAEPFEDADVPILPQEDDEGGGFINPIYANARLDDETVTQTRSFSDFFISDEVRSGFGERDNLLQNIRSLRHNDGDDDESDSGHSENAIRETFNAMRRGARK